MPYDTVCVSCHLGRMRLYGSYYIHHGSYVPPPIYLLSIFFVIIGGISLKHTMFHGKPTPFVMELPAYNLPCLKNIWHSAWEKTIALFHKAGSIIVVATVVVWFLKCFNFSLRHADLDQSMLAALITCQILYFVL